MKIIDIKDVEGCLEGTNVKDLLLDAEIDKEYILGLEDKGKLVYNDRLERPFFKLIVRGKFTLKGVQGKNTMRAVLPNEIADDELKKVVESY